MDYQAPTGWEAKIVSAKFDCDVDQDAAFDCGGATDSTECNEAANHFTPRLPDSVTVTWTLGDADGGLPLADVGDYLVCFRKSSSGTWKAAPSLFGYLLTITRIDEDNTHPIGIYNGQAFSGFANTVSDISVSGSRLNLSPDSRIALNLKDSCGSNADWSFNAPASSNVAAPVINGAKSHPSYDGSAFGATLTEHSVLSLVFENDLPDLGSGSLQFWTSGIEPLPDVLAFAVSIVLAVSRGARISC